MNADEAAALIQQLHVLTAQVNELQQQQPQQSAAPRLKPRKPDTFHGSPKHLSTWLYSMELYCHASGITNDADKIKVALPYLLDAANIWLRKYCPAGQLDQAPWATWADFSAALSSAFGLLEEHQEARDRLDQLRQKRGQIMDDYVNEFRLLHLQLPTVTEDELVHRFRKNIYWDDVKRYITQALSGKDPLSVTFDETAALAVAGERQLISHSQRNRGSSAGPSNWQPRPHTPSPPSNRPVSMEIGNVNARFKERDTLFREGRCFYCKNAGHRKADCPELKKKQGKGIHLQ